MAKKALFPIVEGFSLIEVMVALGILAFGLLAISSLMVSAMRSNSLARSQSTAGIAAQNKLEMLAEAYRVNPSDSSLTPGRHGPEQIDIVNPNDGSALNRYDIHWEVKRVTDPRPGKILNAKLIRVTVTPIRSNGTENSRPGFNKILYISTIFGPEMRRPTE
jgi:prepilin-type N-terminal cleavage/methylation domain-containing protein